MNLLGVLETKLVLAAGLNPVGHVIDGHVSFLPHTLYDLGLTKQAFMFMLAGVLTLLVFWGYARNAGKQSVPSRYGNFVETMIRLGKAGPVRVVDDQVLTPTATPDLSRAVATLLAAEERGTVAYGLYHITSAGQCSWYAFAKSIFELCNMKVDLTPITTAQSGSKAKRPNFSVLGHGKWMAAGFQELRPWREALGDYLRAKGHMAR